MRVRKLDLVNVGIFADQEIEFPESEKSDMAEIHIFTGENGTGKSTILMALAGAFDTFKLDNPLHPSNYFIKRFRRTKVKGKYSPPVSTVRFDDGPFVEIHRVPDYNYLIASRTAGKLQRYADQANRATAPMLALDFAAFAYSGYRHIESRVIDSIGVSSRINPLLESLEFVKRNSESSGFTINNWIANSISKSAVERERDPAKSRKFETAVASLKEALSGITGYRIDFNLQTDPFDLRVNLNGEDLDFDVLPDGLRSLISWIGDLLMRVDSLKWNDDLPAFEKNLILLLDEIEVHLHPAWQRKVLPVVQKLFKNSQIFVSTHSPFVVNSVDGAWVYKLKVENGNAHVDAPIRSEDGNSYRYILREIFDIKEDFGVGAQAQLEKFYGLRDQILGNKNGKGSDNKKSLKRLARDLASQSVELSTIVQFELRQLSKNLGEEISI